MQDALRDKNVETYEARINNLRAKTESPEQRKRKRKSRGSLEYQPARSVKKALERSPLATKVRPKRMPGVAQDAQEAAAVAATADDDSESETESLLPMGALVSVDEEGVEDSGLEGDESKQDEVLDVDSEGEGGLQAEATLDKGYDSDDYDALYAD